MSATFHLYRIRPEVEYKGSVFDGFTSRDLIPNADNIAPADIKLKELGCPMEKDGQMPMFNSPIYDEYVKWTEEQETKAWSDGVKHEMFDISKLNSLNKNNKGWKRYYKRLNMLPVKYFKKNGIDSKYLGVDAVEYSQGWFLKKRFFKKKNWTVICVTKEQMVHFFNQYIDFSNKDNRALETVQRFVNSWEDGMIFECAW